MGRGVGAPVCDPPLSPPPSPRFALMYATTSSFPSLIPACSSSFSCILVTSTFFLASSQVSKASLSALISPRLFVPLPPVRPHRSFHHLSLVFPGSPSRHSFLLDLLASNISRSYKDKFVCCNKLRLSLKRARVVSSQGQT